VKRNTRQKEVIRRVFASTGRPLSPQEVTDLAQTELAGLGIATVYRALKEFVEEGWLVAVSVANGTRYELAKIGHHHHFHCRDCDKVFDIAGCLSGLDAMAPRGFLVDSHELTLNGTCKSCSAHART
jgi:Fur family ferric uptake transcriptional regulator